MKETCTFFFLAVISLFERCHTLDRSCVCSLQIILLQTLCCWVIILFHHLGIHLPLNDSKLVRPWCSRAGLNHDVSSTVGPCFRDYLQHPLYEMWCCVFFPNGSVLLERTCLEQQCSLLVSSSFLWTACLSDLLWIQTLASYNDAFKSLAVTRCSFFCFVWAPTSWHSGHSPQVSTVEDCLPAEIT